MQFFASLSCSQKRQKLLVRVFHWLCEIWRFRMTRKICFCDSSPIWALGSRTKGIPVLQDFRTFLPALRFQIQEGPARSPEKNRNFMLWRAECSCWWAGGKNILSFHKIIVFETLMLLNLTITFPSRVLYPDPNTDLSGFSKKIWIWSATVFLTCNKGCFNDIF